jgi:hypothetical protein
MLVLLQEAVKLFPTETPLFQPQQAMVKVQSAVEQVSEPLQVKVLPLLTLVLDQELHLPQVDPVLQAVLLSMLVLHPSLLATQVQWLEALSVYPDPISMELLLSLQVQTPFQEQLAVSAEHQEVLLAVLLVDLQEAAQLQFAILLEPLLLPLFAILLVLLLLPLFAILLEPLPLPQFAIQPVLLLLLPFATPQVPLLLPLFAILLELPHLPQFATPQVLLLLLQCATLLELPHLPQCAIQLEQLLPQ